ncbi:MAG: hypothetical protein ACI4M9_01495 [Succinivibrio sp.]
MKIAKIILSVFALMSAVILSGCTASQDIAITGNKSDVPMKKICVVRFNSEQYRFYPVIMEAIKSQNYETELFLTMSPLADDCTHLLTYKTWANSRKVKIIRMQLYGISSFGTLVELGTVTDDHKLKTADHVRLYNHINGMLKNLILATSK